MRSRTYDNSQFFKTSNHKKLLNRSETENEKHRIWLDLIDADNESVRTLVGYVSNATNNKDRLFDAIINAQSNEMGIYSIINNERMLIQGRRLPFDNQDKVELGINIPISGVYSIGLSALDGLFSGTQEIYLEDKNLNIIHDLRSMPYSFIAEQGEFKNRFVLRYTNQALGTDDFVSDSEITIATLLNGFSITSNKQNIKAITIHNVLGQKVFEKKSIDSNSVQILELIKNNQALILKINLDNNKEITKKVIF